MEHAWVPWQLVRVSGPSMVPTLHHGDLLLVRRGIRAQVGDVVVARFRSMPDRLVVKRVRDVAGDAVLLGSDNAFAAGDSSTHGPADVCGRVLLCHPAGTRRLRRVG